MPTGSLPYHSLVLHDVLYLLINGYTSLYGTVKAQYADMVQANICAMRQQHVRLIIVGRFVDNTGKEYRVNDHQA